MRKLLIYIALSWISIIVLNAQNSDVQNSYFKAIHFYQMEILDSAINELNKFPEDIECQLFMAKIYSQELNYTKAIEIYKNVSEKNPSLAYFELAVIYANLGFSEESVANLEKHFEYKSPKSLSEINSILAFENISSTSEWRKFWETSRYSRNAEQLEEAKYLILVNSNYEAIDLLENLKYSSNSDLKNFLLAKAYLNLDNLKLALKYVEISLNENSKLQSALELKIEINEKLKNYNDCYNTSLLLLALNKYMPDYLIKHAEICNYIGKFEESESVITKYLNVFPENETALYLLVESQIEQQDFRNALISLNKLIENNSSKFEYFLARANTYFILESWKFAFDDFSMALDINPNLSEAYYKMGTCSFNLDDQEGACHSWKKAASMKNREAAKMLYKNCGY
jgi:tetratricopeptide (TPR) repeat protein